MEVPAILDSERAREGGKEFMDGLAPSVVDTKRGADAGNVLCDAIKSQLVLLALGRLEHDFVARGRKHIDSLLDSANERGQLFVESRFNMKGVAGSVPFMMTSNGLENSEHFDP